MDGWLKINDPVLMITWEELCPRNSNRNGCAFYLFLMSIVIIYFYVILIARMVFLKKIHIYNIGNGKYNELKWKLTVKGEIVARFVISHYHLDIVKICSLHNRCYITLCYRNVWLKINDPVLLMCICKRFVIFY